MALVLGDLYIALLDAGVGEDKARRAAEEVLSATRRSVGVLPQGLALASASNFVLVYMSGIATGLVADLLSWPRDG